MRIALVQQDIVWADPAANRARLDALLAGPVDLCLLPEMFSTGFVTEPSGVAEQSPSPTLGWMKAVAAKKNCAVAGSVAVQEEGSFFNRFYFVKPDGSEVHYDKRHLFTFGGEHRTFTAGTDRCIVEWRGVRFLLLVCYDLRFPVWARNRGDYDAILYVASWPAVRRGAWDTLLRARAIENQCYVAAVHRTGRAPSNEYNGGSVMIDPYGSTIAACPDGLECIVNGELDMEVLQGYRSRFPVLSDSDNFELK